MLSAQPMTSAFSAARHELIAQFEREARAAAATVERVRSSADIAAAVRRFSAGKIAIAEPLDLPAELFADARRLPDVSLGRSKDELATCAVGVTDAFAAVARTGSICLTVDHDYAGPISLLTRGHVAVVAADSIVERPADLFQKSCLGGKGLSRNFVFITGPSATADMGPLVRGVHGPHQLHILILE